MKQYVAKLGKIYFRNWIGYGGDMDFAVTDELIYAEPLISKEVDGAAGKYLRDIGFTIILYDEEIHREYEKKQLS